jgi:hypothetical protein
MQKRYVDPWWLKMSLGLMGSIRQYGSQGTLPVCVCVGVYVCVGVWWGWWSLER